MSTKMTEIEEKYADMSIAGEGVPDAPATEKVGHEAAGTMKSRSVSYSSKRVTPLIDVAEIPSEVFVTKFSPDGNMLAAGCGDGAIRVFDANTGRLNYNLNIVGQDALPTTALAFDPSEVRQRLGMFFSPSILKARCSIDTSRPGDASTKSAMKQMVC